MAWRLISKAKKQAVVPLLGAEPPLGQRHGPSLPPLGLSSGKEGIVFRTRVARGRTKLVEWVVDMDGGGPRVGVTPVVSLGNHSLGDKLMLNCFS